MANTVFSLIPYLTQFNQSLFGKYKLRGNPADLSCMPFFILGSGRNGSTLLSMILNGNSQVFIPPEQYALHYASIRFQLYSLLIWKDLVKIVIGEFADSKNNEGWQTNFNELYNELYKLPRRKRSFQKIIDEIIREVAQQNQENYSIWGDKSPSTIWFLKYIYRIYPKSKYIFLIRDARDVISSYKQGGKRIFGDLAIIENAARNWEQSIHKWNWLKKRASPDQLLEIRYEQLVIDPIETIKEILSFLDIAYEEGMLNLENIVSKRKETKRIQHKGLAYSINGNAIGKWKENMTDAELSSILPIIEKGLKEYKYL